MASESNVQRLILRRIQEKEREQHRVTEVLWKILVLCFSHDISKCMFIQGFRSGVGR